MHSAVEKTFFPARLISQAYRHGGGGKSELLYSSRKRGEISHSRMSGPSSPSIRDAPRDIWSPVEALQCARCASSSCEISYKRVARCGWYSRMLSANALASEKGESLRPTFLFRRGFPRDSPSLSHPGTNSDETLRRARSQEEGTRQVLKILTSGLDRAHNAEWWSIRITVRGAKLREAARLSENRGLPRIGKMYDAFIKGRLIVRV